MQTTNLRTLAVFVTMLSSIAAMGQKTDEIDWFKELSSRITLNGYAQGGYYWKDQTDKQENSFNLKRTLFWAKARVTDRWSFLFMTDFSSVVQEFYTDYRITKNKAMSVKVGQYKTSFSLENPLSPTVLELIDVHEMPVAYLAGGNDPLAGLKYGRDLGLTVYGDILKDKLHYEFAVMNGSPINKTDNNNHKDLIGKLEVRPFDGLRIVTSGYLGRAHAVSEVGWNPQVKVGDNYKRNRYSLGAEWKTGHYAPGKYKEARPFSVRAEWLGGKDGKVGSRGGYISCAIPVTQGVDAIVDAETFDRNTKVDGWDQTNLTVGLQYWFYKKCRLQLQYSRCFCGDNIGKDYNWLQSQLQIAF